MRPETAKAKVTSLGYATAITCTEAGNAHYRAHAHPIATTYLVIKGQLKVKYPEDTNHKVRGKAFTFGAGQRVDVPAGRVYEMWAGAEGSTYVMGA